MNNIVPINQAKMPAAMRQRIADGATTNRNFSGGIQDSFPTLSIRGKVFRIKKDGQELPMVDPNTRQVVPFLDVIMVNASPTLAKSYYAAGFEEGDLNPPDCWSLDAIKPDPAVVNKVSPTCGNCPKNIFGSAMAQDGSKRGGKACADAKRVAVMMPGHLGKAEPLLFLLRIPATSLKNLKAYSDLLSRQGWEPAACVTRLQFDYHQAYPKLEFNFVDSLDDAEYDEIVKHAESPYVASMLSAPDFDAGLSHPATNPAVQPKQRQEAPVLDDTQTVAKTKNEKPDLTVVDDGLVELPTGEYFNPATGEFVKKPAPKVEMPELDPDILALPDGRFFNKTTKQFVNGPGVGAAPMTEEPVKRTRKRRAAAAPQEAAPAPAVQAEAEAEQPAEVKPADNDVKPASADLEAMLKDLTSTRKQ